MAFVIPFNMYFLKGESPNWPVEDALDFVTIMTYLLQVISGLLMIDGILKIKAFFTLRNCSSSLNTKILILHASAFGFYLVVASALCIATIVVDYYPKDRAIFDVYSWIIVAVNVGSFISQVCLVVIFWDLSLEFEESAHKSSLNAEDSLLQSVEMDSRIWNRFQDQAFITEGKVTISIE
jgi:hypothetical protein